MLTRQLHLFGHALAWLSGFVFATVCFVNLGCAVVTWHKLCPDFMCYWAAGKILAAGQSPYDLELQARVQQVYGWDKEADGLGFYDFLPYRYPPSLLGLVCLLLVPLEFATARMTWLMLNAELLFVTGYMLRFMLPRANGWIPLAVVPFFAFSILAVLVGQVCPLILFLVVATWRLLESRCDFLAGFILAWINIKPQLTVLFLFAVLLSSLRSGRWRVIGGFAAGLVPLLAVSTWLAPNWPMQLFWSSTGVPLITAEHPWVGVSWYLLLRSIGLENGWLWGLYLSLAIPAVGWVLRAAWVQTIPFAEIIAQSILAAFLVAPYARIYDLPILIIPLLVLIEPRLEKRWVGALLFVVMVVPYAHFIYWIPPAEAFPVHIWFCWIPLLLTLCWLATRFESYLIPSVMQRNSSLSRQSHNRA